MVIRQAYCTTHTLVICGYQVSFYCGISQIILPAQTSCRIWLWSNSRTQRSFQGRYQTSFLSFTANKLHCFRCWRENHESINKDALTQVHDARKRLLEFWVTFESMRAHAITTSFCNYDVIKDHIAIVKFLWELQYETKGKQQTDLLKRNAS